jgi:hypothetical protein
MLFFQMEFSLHLCSFPFYSLFHGKNQCFRYVRAYDALIQFFGREKEHFSLKHRHSNSSLMFSSANKMVDNIS